MRIHEVAAAFIVIMTCSAAARADPITMTFAGQITFAEGLVLPTEAIFGFPILPGQPFSGAFTYDPSRRSEPLFGETDRATVFSGEPYGISLVFGAEAGRINNLFLRMASTFISVNAYGPLRGGTTYEHSVQLGFFGFEQTDVSTPAPQTLVRLFQPGSSSFRLDLWPYGASDTDDELVRVRGTLTSLSVAGDTPAVVPEPMSMLLVGTGLCGIGAREWRRRCLARKSN
jgi:hypothetical protein